MRVVFLFVFSLLHLFVLGQTRKTNKWIDFGSSHISKWIQIAPGKMGPNALPVPEMNYAIVSSNSIIETGMQYCVMKGDTSINSYLAAIWAVVPGKVNIKIWGIPTETFRTDNSVRDFRQIYYDDNGWETEGGDLWIETYVQLLKDYKKWPDLAINYSLKTTTGSIVNARYTDAPAHIIYLAVGKNIFGKSNSKTEIRVAIMTGFYVWQTNKVEMAQDEGLLLQLGINIKCKKISLKNEIGTYKGYGAYSFLGVRAYNKPVVYKVQAIKEGRDIDWKIGGKIGWRDYNYTAFNFSLIYRFKKNFSVY